MAAPRHGARGPPRSRVRAARTASRAPRRATAAQVDGSAFASSAGVTHFAPRNEQSGGREADSYPDRPPPGWRVFVQRNRSWMAALCTLAAASLLAPPGGAPTAHAAPSAGPARHGLFTQSQASALL